MFSSGLTKAQREAMLAEIHAKDPGRWQETDRITCQTWNPDPQPETSVTWSGPCVEGKTSGYGQMVWTYRTASGAEESALVEATFREGFAQGFGTYHVAGGEFYQGSFAKSQMDGSGTMMFGNGDRYDGEWFRGKMDGRGKMTFATGEIYDGHFSRGQKQGHGISTFPDGSTYEGGFNDDKRHGTGTCHEAATGHSGPCEYRYDHFSRWL